MSGDMTPQDERADDLLILARRFAALLRGEHDGEVRASLARMDRLTLEQYAVVATALVSPGSVDAWWQRDCDVIAWRRRVLVGAA